MYIEEGPSTSETNLSGTPRASTALAAEWQALVRVPVPQPGDFAEQRSTNCLAKLSGSIGVPTCEVEMRPYSRQTEPAARPSLSCRAA
jgi:hypothetical protein